MNNCDLMNLRYEESIKLYEKWNKYLITENEYKKELYNLSLKYNDNYLRRVNDAK